MCSALRLHTTSLVLLLISVATACGGDAGSRPNVASQELIVFNAGSLTRPLRAAIDTFAARNNVQVSQENAGSLELARRITELGHVPDVIALADFEVFPQVLMPEHTSWFLNFARNRMVIAFTDKSRFATELNADNWFEIMQREGVESGRSDPALDPSGYRTLLLFDLAELHYGKPGLAARLLAAAATRNVRPKSADVVALLQAGEVDLYFGYESVARAAGLRYLNLPAEIDLGSASLASSYARARVRVPGATRKDTVTFAGQPIVYALSIPARAPNPELAARFVEFLVSAEGRALMRAQQLDVLESPSISGSGMPDRVSGALARMQPPPG